MSTVLNLRGWNTQVLEVEEGGWRERERERETEVREEKTIGLGNGLQFVPLGLRHMRCERGLVEKPARISPYSESNRIYRHLIIQVRFCTSHLSLRDSITFEISIRRARKTTNQLSRPKLYSRERCIIK